MSDESGSAAAQAELRKMDKIVVAIHGVGSQQRSETIRRVSFRFGSRVKPPMALMPLGFFHVENVGDVKVSRLEDVPPHEDLLQRVGFAEVFWADIPKKVDKDNDTLEEIKDWGRTVVSRTEAAYRRVNVAEQDRMLTRADFQLGAAVIDEVVETVAVMENLLFVAEKMGLFKFDLAPVLRDYVGDVQVVAEFKYYRDRIVYRFHKAMHDVVRCAYEPGAAQPDVYVVAHSEGTVVSFLAMLEALSKPAGELLYDPDAPADKSRAVSSDWIGFVRGYMTIGSPIDKHLVLWPQMWKGLDPTRRTLATPIQWRNYYDYGDPIGFKLDTAAAFLKKRGCSAFAFTADGKVDDFGFSRYWLPGKAHNDYWNDEAVFEHFIQDVVLRQPPAASAKPPVPAPPRPTPPGNRPLVGLVGSSVPYLLSAVLHLGAVFLLFKAVTTFLAGPSDEPQMFRYLTQAVLCLGALLMGVTLTARLPRLVNRRWRWRWLAWVAFGLIGYVFWCYLPDDVGAFFGDTFARVLPLSGTPAEIGKKGLLIVAAGVASTGWWLMRKPGIARRTLIGLGTAAVLLMVVVQIASADGAHHTVWPLVLAGAAFLYLWWLGILIFDLAFVWHRYIRNSVAVDTLGHWYRGNEAPPKSIRQILASPGA